MIELETPAEYLAQLQRLANPARDEPMPPPSNPIAKFFFEAVGVSDHYRLADRQLRIYAHELMATLTQAVPEAAPNLRDLAIGTLETHRPNAMATPAPKGGSVVIVDSALISLLGGLNIVLSLVDIHHRDPKLQNHPELCGSMPSIDTLVEITTETISRYAKQMPINTDWLALIPNSKGLFLWIALLTHAQLKFIVAHELAHVALGHLKDDRTGSIRMIHQGDRDVILRFYRKLREEELQADMVGGSMAYTLAVDQRTDGDVLLGTVGPELLFTHLHLIEKIGKIETREESTHPSAEERRQSIRSISREFIPAAARGMLDRFSKYVAEIAEDPRGEV